MDTSEKQLIEQTVLENRSTLKLYDASHTMTGDRMLVALFVRMEFPVENLYGTGTTGGLPPEDEVRETLGDPVTWEYTKQRYFIDRRAKSEVFATLLTDFNSNMRPYLTHPEFPARYVKKQLKQPGSKKLDNKTKL